MHLSPKHLYIIGIGGLILIVAPFFLAYNYHQMPSFLWKDRTTTVPAYVHEITLRPVRGGYHKVAHFSYSEGEDTYTGIYEFNKLDEQCSVGDSLSITFEKAQPSHYTVRGVAHEKPIKGVNIDSLSVRYDGREY